MAINAFVVWTSSFQKPVVKTANISGSACMQQCKGNVLSSLSEWHKRNQFEETINLMDVKKPFHRRAVNQWFSCTDESESKLVCRYWVNAGASVEACGREPSSCAPTLWSQIVRTKLLRTVTRTHLHMRDTRGVGVDVIGDGLHGKENQMRSSVEDTIAVDLAQDDWEIARHCGTQMVVPVCLEAEAFQQIQHRLHETGALGVQHTER